MTDFSVDALAQYIREIDGNHSMGAAALAENIMQWFEWRQAQQSQPEPSAESPDLYDIIREVEEHMMSQPHQWTRDWLKTLRDKLEAAQQPQPEPQTCPHCGSRRTMQTESGGMCLNCDRDFAYREFDAEAIAAELISERWDILRARVADALRGAHRAGQQSQPSEALQEIIEIYAGMDGFEPETAPEAYQKRIIEQMYEVARRALLEEVENAE